jgi:hypothetical protein
MRNRIEELIAGSASASASASTSASTSAAPGRPAARSSLHGPPARTVPPHQPESRSVTVRDELESALNGAVLSRRDRQFLARLIKWDKRNALSVISLLWRARQAGRAEAALTTRQLEIVLGALSDAATYRESGADSMGCWDCGNFPGGRCSEHAGDFDRARACHELASALVSGRTSLSALPQPSNIAG